MMLSHSMAAGLFGVLAAFFLSMAHAEGVHHEVVKAQELMLKKKRQLGVVALLAAAGRAKSLQEKEQLKRAAKDLAETFLTDKGQRTYELAQSQLSENPTQSLSQLEEVVRQEDHQLQAVILVQRAKLILEDCKGLSDSIRRESVLKVSPKDRSELLVAAALCESDRSQWSLLEKEKLDEVPWLKQLIVAQSAKLAGIQDRTNSELLALALAEPDFPWTWYMLWKYDPGGSTKRLEMAQKYIRLCEAKSEPVRVRFANFPQACKWLAEVKTGLAKMIQDSGLPQE